METRIIEITPSALSHGRLNIRACGAEFFPKSAFGAASKAKGRGQGLQLKVDGFADTIVTDIPADSLGRPRWFFRDRRWVRQFVKMHGLALGGKVEISRLSQNEYSIRPQDARPKTVGLFPGVQLDSDWSEKVGSSGGRQGKNGDLNKLSEQDRPAHEWYRFVLSYPPHLVRDYLHRLGVTKRQRVLDPFCGTGTTLVECQKQEISSVGIEANPMAFFASRTKVDWTPNPQDLLQHADRVAKLALRRLRAQGIEDAPIVGTRATPKSLRALAPDVMDLLLTDSISPLPLHKTLELLNCIDENSDSTFHAHERLALARAVVFSISNLHFGPEVGVNSPKDDAPVIATWLSCVRMIAEDLRWLPDPGLKRAIVHQADSRDVQKLLEPNSIDAVITSPPYPNEKDYTRTTRLESVLLGFIKSKAELQGLKKSLVRSNTRSVYKDDTDDRWISEHPEVQRIADAIEARRLELGKTSGFERMYHRVTKLYFGGMARHLAQLSIVLRRGARVAYVVGDQASYLRVMIRTGQLLAEIGESLGYELVKIDLFRTRLATATREQLREEVVVLRWPGASKRSRASARRNATVAG